MNWTLPLEVNGSYNRSLAKKFYDLIDPLANNEISISYGKSILHLSYIDVLRLLYEQNPENKKERIFKNLILKNFSDAEKRCPGSGIIATLSFLKCVGSDFDFDLAFKDLKDFSYKSRRSNLDELNKVLDAFAPDNAIREICERILEDGGFSASCDVETTYDLLDTLSVINSCEFNVRLDANFSAATKISSFKHSYPDILVADGIVEEVSEIHHILEHYSKTKKPCFLISRGFSNDVINTLSTNYKRGSLRVIPGTLVYNLDSINSLKDICTISNCDMISTLKGDRFSTVDLREIKSVEYINLSQEKLEIKNSNEYPRVVNLIKHLRKQIDEEVVDDKKEILEKRISQLSPRKVKIKLSNHKKDGVGLSKDRIKMMISLINSTCQFGIIDLKKYSGSNFINQHVVDFLREKGFDLLPARSFFDGVKVGLSNAKLVNSTSQAILIDTDS